MNNDVKFTRLNDQLVGATRRVARRWECLACGRAGGSSLPLSRGGFTMVELMAVIVVIMLTVGMIIGGAGYLTRKAGIARAETEIAQIEAALEEFKSQFGAYPAQYFDVCNVLTGRNVDVTIASPSYTNSIPPVRPPRPFMPEFKSLDPFGQPYNYRGPGDANRRNKSSFDLWSNGPNRTTTAGGDDNNDPKDVDNIRNWK